MSLFDMIMLPMLAAALILNILTYRRILKSRKKDK